MYFHKWCLELEKKTVNDENNDETESIDIVDDTSADIIDDLVQANFNDKPIYLCYDCDMWRNSKVYSALYSLSAYLISEKNAIVKIIELPEGDAKGLDDFLMAYGADEFQKLMDKAKPLCLKDIQNKLAGQRNKVEFPLDFFPIEIADTIKDLHKKLDAPIEYIACTMLTTISIIMDGHFALNVKPSSNWVENPILWMAIIGNPSQKKTPCLKIGKDILDSFDSFFTDLYEKDLRQYNADMKKYEVEKQLYNKEIKETAKNA